MVSDEEIVAKGTVGARKSASKTIEISIDHKNSFEIMFTERRRFVPRKFGPSKAPPRAKKLDKFRYRNRLGVYTFDGCYKTSAICPGIGANSLRKRITASSR